MSMGEVKDGVASMLAWKCLYPRSSQSCKSDSMNQIQTQLDVTGTRVPPMLRWEPLQTGQEEELGVKTPKKGSQGGGLLYEVPDLVSRGLLHTVFQNTSRQLSISQENVLVVLQLELIRPGPSNRGWRTRPIATTLPQSLTLSTRLETV